MSDAKRIALLLFASILSLHADLGWCSYIAEGADKQIFLILEDGSWGHISESGEVVVPPRYRKAANFFEGLAAACEEKACGFLSPNGEWAIPPRFESLGRFSEGLAVVLLEGRFVYIDREGKVVIDTNSTDPPCRFSSGLACFRAEGDLVGFMNRSGEVVVEPRFGTAQPLREGMAAVQIGRGVSLEGGWGFVDVTGEMVIEARFRRVDWFSQGLAAVKEDDKWGYIDREGRYQIEPRFELAGPFSEGLANVTVDGLGGYIDHNGEFVIPPRYGATMPFAEGLAAVKEEAWNEPGPSFFIDRTGSPVLTLPTALDTSSFHGPLAFVIVEQGARYINRRGNIVWECSELDDEKPPCGAAKTFEVNREFHLKGRRDCPSCPIP
jgi:hypothetical protein